MMKATEDGAEACFCRRACKQAQRRQNREVPEGIFRFTKAFANMVGPGDLNQRLFRDN